MLPLCNNRFQDGGRGHHFKVIFNSIGTFGTLVRM